MSIHLSTFRLLRRSMVFSSALKKSCSSQSMTSTIPSNLHLADTKVLLPPEKDLIPDERYFFSSLASSLPASLPVYSFENPGEIVAQAPLNGKIFSVAIRKDIVLEIVRYFRNKKRQPQCTKRIPDIAGSNKKPR